MKKTISYIVILILLLSTANKAHSFTCGTKFFSKGDLDFEVLNDCGEPISREVIGYTLSEDQKREYKISDYRKQSFNRRGDAFQMGLRLKGFKIFKINL